MIAKTPPPPYWAVIFSAVPSGADLANYESMAGRMVELAHQQPGFLGYETAQGEGGAEITVCYWETEAQIRAWKQHSDHLEAQRMGREVWYSAYHIRIVKVERAYGF
ncbi:MAG: antibiotic biosynthesis monooxygenase family protein [Hyphomonas sp.]